MMSGKIFRNYSYGKFATSHVSYLTQLTNQLNQLINQSTNQLINQSTNQLINQSTNQPINQSTNQLINHRNAIFIEKGFVIPEHNDVSIFGNILKVKSFRKNM